MMNSCEKCGKVLGILLLVLGVLFLLRDINVWNFWNIQWWTALFILAGVVYLATGSCGDCKKMRKN